MARCSEVTLLQQLADNAGATMKHLNDSPGRIYRTPYIDYAVPGKDLTTELAALVSDYVEFGKHEADSHRLQEKLEPSAS